MIEHAARVTGDAQKLSMEMRPLVDLLREADFCAGRASRCTVTTEDVPAAIDAQSYAPVEGDSASLAELCALLSAVAGVPMTQSLAVTGSVDQHGRVQAVGGIKEKIEGSFDPCAERGLAGEQGVVIPCDNVQTLMLRQDVIDAVGAGRFHVFAVGDVDEAMALLTGRPAGIRDDAGRFPEASVNGLVDARLASFAETARAFVARQLAP